MSFALCVNGSVGRTNGEAMNSGTYEGRGSIGRACVLLLWFPGCVAKLRSTVNTGKHRQVFLAPTPHNT